MKKIVLLGDSIRLFGYGKKVPDLLGSEYQVWQPTDNCRFAQYTLRGCFDWKENLEGSDVIHWNNGLWDVTELFGDGNFTPLEQYVATMKRVAGLLLGYSKHVIFATTTPVAETYPYNDNGVIRRYNETVSAELSKMGITINDLHKTVASDVDRYLCDDMLHLSEAGAEACAKQVCDCIRCVCKKC